MGYRKITRLIDGCLIKPAITHEEMNSMMFNMKLNGFKTLYVCPNQVATVAKVFDSVGTIIGDDLNIDIKVLSAKKAIEDGAKVVAFFVDLCPLRNREYDKIDDELCKMGSIIKALGAKAEVYIQNEYLTKDELVRLCRMIKRHDIDRVSLWITTLEKEEACDELILAKMIFNKSIELKVSGYIKDLETLLQCVKAGATSFNLFNASEIGYEIRKAYEK